MADKINSREPAHQQAAAAPGHERRAGVDGEVAMSGARDEITILRLLCRALEGNRLVVLASPISEPSAVPLVRHRLSIQIPGDEGELLGEREFMPTAERFGLLWEVDRQVVRQAVGIAARGSAVQVSLAADTFGHPDLLASVKRQLELTGADPSLIFFEVEDAALEANRVTVESFLDRIRLLGCGVALDRPRDIAAVAVA